MLLSEFWSLFFSLLPDRLWVCLSDSLCLNSKPRFSDTFILFIFMQAAIFPSEMAKVEEIAAIFKRFGDEQSTLLDQYERLSFEVQLNKAMLGRSFSEPAVVRRQPPPKPPLPNAGKQGRRAAGFQKVMKKLFSPILGKKGSRKEGDKETKNPFFSKNFSRSLRVWFDDWIIFITLFFFWIIISGIDFD